MLKFYLSLNDKPSHFQVRACYSQRTYYFTSAAAGVSTLIPQLTTRVGVMRNISGSKPGMIAWPPFISIFCCAAYFNSADLPRLDGSDIIHNDRDFWILLCIPPFLALGEVMSADIDRARVRIVTKCHRNDMRLAI